jgi:hypothetical protein
MKRRRTQLLSARRRLALLSVLGWIFIRICYELPRWFPDKEDPFAMRYPKMPLHVEPSATCVYAKWPSGWGNVLYSLFYGVIQIADNTTYGHLYGQKYACIQGYGGMVAGLFSNLQQCPRNLHHSKCYDQSGAVASTSYSQSGHTASSGKVSFSDIRVFLKARRDQYPDLFQINATFADEIFEQAGASFRSKDLLENSCAVHLRFGDKYSRKEEQMSEKNRRITAQSSGRACRAESREVCFAQLTEQVRTSCPDPTVPTYIAADVPQFVQYFCEQEIINATGRPFLSSCQPNIDQISHINDVGVPLIDSKNGYAINPQGLPTFVTLLSDWLALVLAQNMTRLGHSTFSETAAFPFYT